MLGPFLAQTFKEGSKIPFPRLQGESGWSDMPQGGQDMDMGVPRVSVQGKVRDHSVVNQFRADEFAHYVPALGDSQFKGKGYFNFSGELRVDSLFDGLDLVPQLGTVVDPGRGIGRGHDVGEGDSAALVVVVAGPSPVVSKGGPGTVGRCGNDGSAG